MNEGLALQLKDGLPIKLLQNIRFCLCWHREKVFKVYLISSATLTHNFYRSLFLFMPNDGTSRLAAVANITHYEIFFSSRKIIPVKRIRKFSFPACGCKEYSDLIKIKNLPMCYWTCTGFTIFHGRWAYHSCWLRLQRIDKNFSYASVQSKNLIPLNQITLMDSVFNYMQTNTGRLLKKSSKWY